MTSEEKKLPVPTGSQVPVAPQDYGEYSGQGFEGTSAADFVMPYLVVLQDGSPETKKPKAEYVPGAEQGMFLNSVTKQLYDGNVGVIFVPCFTHHEFVEWKRPRGKGGPVGRHAPSSSIVRAAQADAAAKKLGFGKLLSQNGNSLAETFTIFGMMLNKADDTSPAARVLLVLSSTKITPYKKIMSRLRAIEGPPLFSNRLRITTAPEHRDSGDSFNVLISPLIDNDVIKSQIPVKIDGKTNPLLILGEQLKDMARSGAAHAADEPQEQEDGGKDSMTGPDGKPLF